MFNRSYRIFPFIVLAILIAVIGVGIYQLFSDRNPWNLGISNENAGWEFLEKKQ